MKVYKVLICGDRDWGNMKAIEQIITAMKIAVKQDMPNTELVIISGGAPGADTMARLAAHKLDVHCCEVMALWGTRHRAAGPQRNAIMAALEPDACFAFHSDLAHSRGTKNMVALCRRRGIDVQVIDS